MVILSEVSEGSSSGSLTSDHRYDVFLSFRGEDTRQSFTNHLHKALQDANIITFLDDEEIQTGEHLKPELESAIKASSASIVVLSINYASSTWCLDELRKTSKHIVVPIFYHVEPTDVRKQQSSFGNAFTIHKHRLEAETNVEKRDHLAHKMDLWKKALAEVSDLKGMNANGWLETKFIEEIVRHTSSRLDLHLHSMIPHLIGMRSSVSIITSWLKDGSSHTADILTIWGMAGIGKTSLARYIYQLHFGDFARSSFIEDIERKCTSAMSSFLGLQKHILEDIQKGNSRNLQDVNVCTIKTEKALLANRTLLVLDGINNFEQLDVLFGTKGFHPGSKIIITTKDGSLTEKCGLFHDVLPKHMKHLLEGLDETESLQLLSWHAFRSNDPKEGYKEEARKVVKHCRGHPLALKVLGSSLRNEDVLAWEDTVKLLEKEVNSNIQNVLRISFDSLPYENDKELFKHIACFFVGKDREFTETILKDCGISTTSGFKILIDRCLITVGRRNELMMHQLLQDMGRDLVHQESPDKPWKRTRLWRHEESYDVLKHEKGTSKVQGLVLDMKMIEKDTNGTSSSIEEKFRDDFHVKSGALHWFHRVYNFFSRLWCLFAWIFQFRSSQCNSLDLKTNSLSKLDKLRLLQLNYVKLQGSYNHFPKGLRWLSMHGFALSYIPLDLQMENMVALDISHSNLQQLWTKPTLLPSLKILNLSSTKIVRMSDFQLLPALERLILAGCVRLIEVCKSIGQCTRLVLLDLSYCNKLKRLPRSTRKLKRIRILSIGGCANLDEFPREIKEMESLEVLNASDIIINSQASSYAIVKGEPRRVKSLSLLFPCSLVSLSLRNNNLFNESFPSDFSSLSKLKVLNLSRNPFTSLPDCISSLSALEFLCLEGYQELKSVFCLPRTIKFVDANKCLVLEKITFHPEYFTSGLPNTGKFLDANRCNSLQKTTVHEEVFSRTKISFLSSESLNEIEGLRKVQPLAQVEEKLLHYLGWSDLEHVKNQKVQVFDGAGWDRPKKLPVQMFYELGIFSTSFRGENIPKWFIYRSNGPTITFTVPSSPYNLRGLNMGYVYTEPFNNYCDTGDIVSNMTKKRKYSYEPNFRAFGETGDGGSIVCLRHWLIGKTEMEEGDEVTIRIAWSDRNGVKVSQCGISFVYDDGNDDEDPLADYKLWRLKLRSDWLPDDGRYRLWSRHCVSPPPDQFELVATHKFWNYIPPRDFFI